MRTGGSGAQVQSGQAQMWHGTGHGQATGYRYPCHCHVRAGAESPQDSVRSFAARSFAAAYVFGGCFCATGKRCNCSGDII